MTRVIARRPIRNRNALDISFRDMDRFLGGLLGQSQSTSLDSREWLPAVDIRETDEAFSFVVELPGLSKDEIEITVEDKVLTLSGERKWDEEQDRNSYRRIERNYGSFNRSFTLPRDVNAEAIEAVSENGLLTVVVPKAPESRPHRIEIQ